MNFNNFTNEDFQVFQIDDFAERMDGIKTQIRPKLNEIGAYFAPFFSTQLGEEMYYHVAKHARRTVNPPKDTWVAFSDHSRGYKMRPHFQIGLWDTHLFIWFAIIYEAPNKELYAQRIMSELDTIYERTKKDFVWSQDHTKPNVFKHDELTKDELQKIIKRFETVKKGEFLCGYEIRKEKVVNMTGEELLKKIEEVFEDLLYLYELTLNIKPVTR